MSARSRDTKRPRLALEILRPPKSEGAGNAGCALHPRSRVQWVQEGAHTSIQVSGEHPTFPAQWLYGLLRALPGEPCTLATVAPEKRELLKCLTPASGRQDHTTSPYALAPFVFGTTCVHRDPSLVRDDGQRPSDRDGMARNVPLICPSDKAKYF